MFMLRKSHLFAFAVVLAMITSGVAFTEDTSKEQVLKPSENAISQEDILKVSEAFGHFIGRNLNSPGIKLDLERMILGMRNGAAGKPAPMTDEEYDSLMANLQEKAFSSLADENLRAANEFLSKNAHAAGVIEIEPGKLQYIVLEEGHEPVITEHSTPLIHYTGKYMDGTVFGSSAEVGGPITLPLDQTIPGFRKGITGMKEGEKRRLFVHPDLGYGKSGQLPPNTLLIFEVEAIKANAPEQEHLSAAESESDDALDLLEADDDSEFDSDISDFSANHE